MKNLRIAKFLFSQHLTIHQQQMVDCFKQYSLEYRSVHDRKWRTLKKNELIANITRKDDTGRIADPLNEILINNTVQLDGRKKNERSSGPLHTPGGDARGGDEHQVIYLDENDDR